MTARVLQLQSSKPLQSTQCCWLCTGGGTPEQPPPLAVSSFQRSRSCSSRMSKSVRCTYDLQLWDDACICRGPLHSWLSPSDSLNSEQQGLRGRFVLAEGCCSM